MTRCVRTADQPAMLITCDLLSRTSAPERSFSFGFDRSPSLATGPMQS